MKVKPPTTEMAKEMAKRMGAGKPAPVGTSEMQNRLNFIAAYKKLCDQFGCFILSEGEGLEVAELYDGHDYWGIDRCKGTPGETDLDRWNIIHKFHAPRLLT